ncbi:MAG: hypothetical protein GF368_04345 [Candidatus Aenigmarchaeota archaeon]|nr:hypothetical protein [Candidatus Aenigmarchaeota archaeon]
MRSFVVDGRTYGLDVGPSRVPTDQGATHYIIIHNGSQVTGYVNREDLGPEPTSRIIASIFLDRTRCHAGIQLSLLASEIMELI